MLSLRIPTIFMGIAILLGGSSWALGDDLESLTADPQAETHVVIATKPLPVMDCWRCLGPRPCAPCYPTGGFLYYETNPWDDDPLGRMHACPHGDCGSVATAMSLHWIRCQELRPRLFHKLHAPPCE